MGSGLTAMQKVKECSICRGEFIPFKTTDKTCSYICQIEELRQRDRRKRAKEARKAKKAYYAQDRSYQLRKAQEAFNAYIRKRDKDKPCISCGAPPGKYRITAGHYRSVGSAPELRFNPDNCFGQCWWNCNSNKSGNSIEMRKGMIERIGVERVEFIEGPHDLPKLTLDEIIEIKQRFKDEARRLP